MWDFLHALPCMFISTLLWTWYRFDVPFYENPEVFGMSFLNKNFCLTNKPNIAFLHEWFTYLYKNTFRSKKERILCALNFLPLIRNSFILPSSSTSLCSMLAHNTKKKKKKKKKKSCGSRQGKVLRNFHSFFFRWK